jgi:H+/Cl- antiporter ClcA
MNPLEWKREHQIALLISAGIGFVFGFIFGLQEVSLRGYELYWSGDHVNDHSINFYWAIVVVIGLLGALIGAAIIYAAQLMRQ